MYRKKGRVRAPQHRGRKRYEIPVSKQTHETLHTVARVLGETPGAVVARLLDPTRR